jgi:DNA-binding MarR family transcriptional regulator
MSRTSSARHSTEGPAPGPKRGSAPAGRSLHVHVGEATHQLDRLIHERLRLGIVSALAVNESLAFTDLREMLSTTDGNLSVHARKLEEAGYIHCTKSFDGRMPRTAYNLTATGRKALAGYLDHMEALIHTMRG